MRTQTLLSWAPVNGEIWTQKIPNQQYCMNISVFHLKTSAGGGVDGGKS